MVLNFVTKLLVWTHIWLMTKMIYTQQNLIEGYRFLYMTALYSNFQPALVHPPPSLFPQRGRGEYSVHSKLYTFKFYIHTTQYKHHLYKSLAATTPLPPPPHDAWYMCDSFRKSLSHNIIYLKYLYCNSAYPFSFSVHLVLEGLI